MIPIFRLFLTGPVIGSIRIWLTGSRFALLYLLQLVWHHEFCLQYLIQAAAKVAVCLSNYSATQTRIQCISRTGKKMQKNRPSEVLWQLVPKCPKNLWWLQVPQWTSTVPRARPDTWRHLKKWSNQLTSMEGGEGVPRRRKCWKMLKGFQEACWNCWMLHIDSEVIRSYHKIHIDS